MLNSLLVVSLHDVSPLTRERCEDIVAEMALLGVPRLSLLVIPNHHERGHVREDSALCEWLRAREGEGYEVVTHGYFHRRARRGDESLVQRLMTRAYTADEGEFYDLDRRRAAELVTRGNADLRELGLDPRGFIAPAWLLSAEAEDALRELGCEYTTRLRGVADLRSGVWHESQSLCWSVRAAWRRACSLAWNAWLYRRLDDSPLLRVAVHPVDIEHPRIWRQIRALIVEALRTREPMTYLDWIMRQREDSRAS
ncbi:MAG: polysaccharide deacetylase family protein [Chthoniobacteraceae bacterium]